MLFLTKPLGTGIIATALKAGRAPESLVAAAVASMVTAQSRRREVLQALPADAVHACTDVTGFGLIGHACEVAAASRVTLEIDASAIPVIEGVASLVQGNIPGGGRTNAAHFGPDVRLAAEVDPGLVDLFHDPQTSGGLFVSVDAAHALRGVHGLDGHRTHDAVCRPRPPASGIAAGPALATSLASLDGRA